MAAPGDAPMPGVGVGGLRNHHYFFAHMMLWGLFFENPERLVKALRSEQGPSILKDMWEGASRQFGVELDFEGLGISKPKIATAWEVVIVHVPEPKFMTEAYLVGLVVRPGGRFLLWERPLEARFFTLEYHGPGVTVFGGWEREGGHLNFGDGCAPDPGSFAAWILQRA